MLKTPLSQTKKFLCRPGRTAPQAHKGQLFLVSRIVSVR